MFAYTLNTNDDCCFFLIENKMLSIRLVAPLVSFSQKIQNKLRMYYVNQKMQ